MGRQGMTDFRKLMSIINEAQVEAGHTPPKYDPNDDVHYDAMKKTGYFGKQGAGAILLAKNTGRVLLMHRSSEVHMGMTWGGCGGAFDPDTENKIDKVRKEIKEETGYVSRVPLVPLPFIFRDGTFAYHNYLGLVDNEFEPVLGWESIDYIWCEYGHWKSPLHPGVAALFSDPESEKIIKHYASLYRHSDEHPEISETLDEDMVVTPNIANTMATQAATQAASANANGATSPAQAAQGSQGSVPAQGSATPAPNDGTPPATGTTPAAPTPAPGTPTTTAPGTGGDNDSAPATTTPKSLAPITSQ